MLVSAKQAMTDRGTSSIEVVQLYVHLRPIGEHFGGGVLTKFSVVTDPALAAELTESSHYEELVFRQIVPSVWEVGANDQAINREGF